jgi:hypothetical protein
MKKVIFFVILFLSSTFQSFAQKDSIKQKGFYLWGSYGVSYSYSKNPSVFGGGRVSLNSSRHQKNFITVLYEGRLALNEFPFYTDIPNSVLELESFSIMYGRGKFYRNSLALIGFIGLNFGKVEYRGDFLYEEQGGGFLGSDKKVYEYNTYNYIGLPLDFKILWTTPVIGLSLDIYVNFHKYIDYGLVLGINLGKIRNRRPDLSGKQLKWYK